MKEKEKEKKAKLLFFASDYKIGLSTLLTQELIAFKNAGINLTCVAGENEQEYGLSEQLRKQDIDIIRIQGLDNHANFKFLSKQITSIIKENAISHVHVQNNWQLLMVTYCKYAKFVPERFSIIYTLHGFRNNHVVKSYLAVIIIGFFLFLFANKIIVMSEYVKKKFFFLSYKIKKLYLGVDSSFFEKRENEIPTDIIRMVFPAQFRLGKNQDLLIDAVERYKKQNPESPIELYLPGTGEFLNDSIQLVKNKKLEDVVFFPGQCTKDEIRKLYEQCNIGVVSSNSETFGQSIVEPFVLGRCVITRKVGVAIDIIKDGESGFFYDTSEELTAILQEISKDINIVKRIGNSNFLNRGMFSWQNIASIYTSDILCVENLDYILS